MRQLTAGARQVEVRLRHLALQRQERVVLDDVSWTIRPGQRWVLAGGNGAGKTQLLKLISGAVWPTAASAVAGAGAHGASPAAGKRASRTYRWRNEIFQSPFEVREEIAYVGPERQDKYERYGWNHTVEQIVGTGTYRTDIPLNPLTAADHRRIAALLKRLAIGSLAGRRFLSLSYGERRLTLLARALASRPKLLLLDELLSGLDETNHKRALRWLQHTSRSSMPWVLATHRVEDVPSSATHALVLEMGRVVYSGVLRGAPLERWLNEGGASVASASPRRALTPAPTPASPRALTPASRRALTPASSRALTPASRRALTPASRRALTHARDRAAPGAGRMLLRLTRASVYLDEHRVLEKLSFEVHSGECWVVHGPNGSGKTTLLRTLYGDHGVASGGRIERAGIEAGVPLQEFKRRVGIVAPHLQSDHPQEMTVAQVVQSGRHASIGLNDAPTAADRAAAARSLEFFGLSDLASRTLRELSYGQLRRVLFARAWSCRPSLLLLDEPFSGVDAPTRLGLMAHVAAMVSKGSSVVMTTHYRSEWPLCTTHELELFGGRALYCGPVRSTAALSSGSAGG